MDKYKEALDEITKIAEDVIEEVIQYLIEEENLDMTLQSSIDEVEECRKYFDTEVFSILKDEELMIDTMKLGELKGKTLEEQILEAKIQFRAAKLAIMKG